MCFFVLLLTIVGVCSREMAITREYTDYLKKHVSWKVADYEDNIFRGWSMEEFENLFVTESPKVDLSLPYVEAASALPSTLSWSSGCTHPVKNGNNCGATWVFAVAGMLSDRCCINSQTDKGWLSIQELISCDAYSQGCQGGSAVGSLFYVLANNGLVDETCLPYTFNGTVSSCPTACKNGRGFTSSHICKCNGPMYCRGVEGMMTCLQSGPIAATFMVEPSFTAYESGTYECTGTSTTLVGSVVIEGYNNSTDCYWIARNSFGTNWGMDGYINIACTTCGIHENINSGNIACTGVA